MTRTTRNALRLLFALGEFACWLSLLLLARDFLVEHWLAALSVFMGYLAFFLTVVMISAPLMDWRAGLGGLVTVAISAIPAAPFLIYGAFTLGWPVGLFGVLCIGNMAFDFAGDEV